MAITHDALLDGIPDLRHPFGPPGPDPAVERVAGAAALVPVGRGLLKHRRLHNSLGYRTPAEYEAGLAGAAAEETAP